jgi:hypothetical protein
VNGCELPVPQPHSGGHDRADADRETNEAGLPQRARTARRGRRLGNMSGGSRDDGGGQVPKECVSPIGGD